MASDLVAVLEWPWSLSSTSERASLQSGRATLPFHGLAVLACPRQVRLLPMGKSADLAAIAQTAEMKLYELPQGRVGSSESALEMQGYFDATHARWFIGLDGARARFEKTDGGQRNESIESISVFDWWDAFDDLVTLRSGQDAAVPWEDVEGWLGQQSRSREPRAALIVEIAESLGSSIIERSQHLRRILLRQRDLVPIHMIKQIDEECLRWYIRQPGETLAEKAGHRQEIMSVVRHETFDTLENQILKDFLQRCSRSCARYLRRFQSDYPNSQRVLVVRRYLNSCEQALTFPEFDHVQRPRPGALPNYVLQSDTRYRDVWRWYQKLLRNQDSEEQIWNWQARLWADVCRLLLGASCQLQRRSGRSLTNAPLLVEAGGKLGGRLGKNWAPGPFLVRRSSGAERVLSIVDASETQNHTTAKVLGLLGAHCILIEEQLGGVGSIDALVIWSLNGMATTGVLDPREIVRSATQALSNARTIQPSGFELGRLDGLVLVSRLGSLSSTQLGLDSESSAGPRVAVIEVGSDPRSWQDAVVEIAAQMETWL